MKLPAYCSIAFLLLARCSVRGQENPGRVFLPNQELRVSGLPARTAPSADPAAVLVAALETIFHDPEVCCGKKSALQDPVLSADPLSFKDLSTRMQGSYALGDGRRITVTAEYVPPGSINTSKLLAPLMRNEASLIEWKSHLYVLYGAIFDEVRRAREGRLFEIHKLFLLDARFSDARREVSFDREGNNQTDLQGLLILQVNAR